MKIRQENNGDEGRFYLEDDGSEQGEMRYSILGDQMEIYHTEVDEALRGQHLGDKLVEAGVDYARENNFKIIPSCTFAKAVFVRKKDYSDVLA